MKTNKKMRKLIVYFTGLVAVISLIYFTTPVTYALDCNAKISSSWVSRGGSGQPALIMVTNSNTAPCPAQVTFMSYQVFIQPPAAGWLKTQRLFDTKTITINSGETLQMSVNTANCKTQSDAYKGEGVPFFTNDTGPFPTLMLGDFSSDTNLCASCSNQCSLGQKQCVGNGWQECVTGNDGCTIWSGTTLCGANQICSGGNCINTCQPQTCSQLGMQCGTVYDGCTGNINCGSCSNNQTCQNGHCVSNCQPKTCSQLGYQCGSSNDGCGNTISCGNCSGNQTCQNGTCVTNCQNQCQLGDKRCSGNGYQVCGNYDDNGCTVWGQVISCSDHQYCENGNCNRTKQNLNVSLSANSGCAPLHDVALRATVNGSYGYDSNYGQNELTYYFDCGNGGSKTVTTTDTDVIVNDLCNYENIGNYTARVRVESDGVTATDSVTIDARNCTHYEPVIVPVAETLQIQKTVADMSNGTNYQTAVTASPNDNVSFKIAVGTNTSCQNIFVNDIIPAGVENPRDLRIDGMPVNGDIVSGIALGDLHGGQTRIITFTTTVDGPGYFPFGQTTLINTATARNSNISNSSTASVYVWRQAVLGATKVSTGIADSDWTNYLLAAVAASVVAIWLFRDKLSALLVNLKTRIHTAVKKI